MHTRLARFAICALGAMTIGACSENRNTAPDAAACATSTCPERADSSIPPTNGGSGGRGAGGVGAGGLAGTGGLDSTGGVTSTGGVFGVGGAGGSGQGGAGASSGSGGTGLDAGRDGAADGNTLDAGKRPLCAGQRTLPCKGTSTSSLPNVFTELNPVRCTYTVKEAMAGIDVPFTVVVEDTVAGVLAAPLDNGGCWQPDSSGLETFVDVSGGGQHYCLCDIGLCHDPIALQFNLSAGCHTGTVHWAAVNWTGPSDTNNPKGAAFPPGDYVVKLRQAGHSPVPFELDASITVTLTP